MTTRRRQERQKVLSQYTARSSTAQVQVQAQPPLILAPCYEKQAAFGASGALRDASQVGEQILTNRARVILERTLRTGDLDIDVSAWTGARKVLPQNVQMYASVGSVGNATTVDVSDNVAGDQVLLRSSTGIMFTQGAGAQTGYLSDNAVNFLTLFASVGVSNTSATDVADASKLYVKVGDEVYLVDTSNTTKNRLAFYRDGLYNTELLAPTTKTYSLYLGYPRYRVLNGPTNAGVKIYSVSYPNLGSASDRIIGKFVVPSYGDVDSTRVINLSDEAVSVVFTSAAGALNVSVDGTEVTITMDSGGADPTIADINDALYAAFDPEVPLVLLDEAQSGSDTEVDRTLDTTVEVAASTYLDVPMYFSSLAGSPEVSLTIPTDEDYAPAPEVPAGGWPSINFTMPGRDGIIMGLEYSAEGFLWALNSLLNDDAEDADGDRIVYDIGTASSVPTDTVLPSFGFKVSIEDLNIAGFSEARILPRAGETAATYTCFTDGSGVTLTTLNFSPASVNGCLFVARNDVSGSSGNGAAFRYALTDSVSLGTDYFSRSGTEVTLQIPSTDNLPSSAVTFSDLTTWLATQRNELNVQIYAVDPDQSWYRGTNGEIVTGVSSALPITPDMFLGSATAIGFDNVPFDISTPHDNATVTAHGAANGRIIWDDLSVLWSITDSIPVRFHVEYKALRFDLTAETTVSIAGREPDFLTVDRASYTTLLGPAEEDNPLSLAVEAFYTSGVTRPVLVGCLDDGDGDSADALGSLASIQSSLNLAERRGAYHIGVLRSDLSARQVVAAWSNEMAGTFYEEGAEDGTPVPRTKPAFSYVGMRLPSVSPALPTTTATISYVSPSDRSSVRLTVQADSLSASDLEAGNLVVVIDETPELVSAPTQVDGDIRGFVIQASSVGGNPYAYTLEAELPVSASVGDSITVYRLGSSLFSNGIYDTDAAVQAIYDVENADGNYSFGMQKCLCESVTLRRQRVASILPGEYYVPIQMGFAAQFAPAGSLTGVPFPKVLAVSAVERFSEREVEEIAGAGITFLHQPGGSGTECSVWADLSSDPTTELRVARYVKVLDDFLQLQITAAFRKELPGKKVTESFINSMMILLSPFIDEYAQFYKELELVGFREITDADRVRFNITSSGIISILRRVHFREARVGIIDNIISF